MFILPDLPYAHDALAPTISAETMRFHHGKHHRTYVDTLNRLLEEAGETPDALEEVVRSSQGKLFNNAAQAWNHAFFWKAMSPDRTGPSEDLARAIGEAFGDMVRLKAAFVTEGVNHFASGWVWLVAENGALKVCSTHDARDPVPVEGVTPLLVCDLWEHAYYIDYRNDRKGFLEAWFDALPNWTFASRQWAAASGHGEAWAYPSPGRHPGTRQAAGRW